MTPGGVVVILAPFVYEVVGSKPDGDLIFILTMFSVERKQNVLCQNICLKDIYLCYLFV